MNTLQTPIRINQLQLKDCLVMPPMATNRAGADGEVTDALCRYYAEKSAGGVIGLIITEHSYISPEGKAGKGQLSISRDEDIPGLRRLVDVIHENGVKVMAQISHAGASARPDDENMTLVSASAVRPPRQGPPKGVGQAPRKMGQVPKEGPMPKEMEPADIRKVIDDFTAAARRARAAGYDGVEIHSAHGYLLNQFYSPLTNKRTDAYNGSSIEGRTRLHLEILRAVREAVGAQYPVALRLGACDYMPGGSTVEDSVAAAKAFEGAGLDLLDISGGFCGFTNPNCKEQGYFSEITEELKKHLTIPVLLTGGVVDRAAADSLLAGQKADMIGVGRALLKDSDWARKAMEDKGSGDA